ncbi:leucine-rich repeat-containing protein 42-like [Clavelina lepadiformis]|uniref:leucine-rich repeat-containing protein 42-like n=1 Tax=Clavelina lepadiformis TaxID=159417 RepID=UPI0040415332
MFYEKLVLFGMEPFGNGKIYHCNMKTDKWCTFVYSIKQHSNEVSYKVSKSMNAVSKAQHYMKSASQFTTKSDFEFDVLLPLRKICILYVANNLHLVESLCGFPELIGKEIFDSCVEFGHFEPNNNENWKRALQIFTDAYEKKLLEKLQLCGKWMFLSSSFDCITPYLYLEELDLSSCRIGNEHEALVYVGTLSCLKKLVLCNNNISLKGMKNLTQHHRRAGKGLENLESLRLDGNAQITVDVFPYLETVEKLTTIVVDHTQMIIDGIISRKKVSKFNVCPHPARYHIGVFRSSYDCIGKGWAVSLINSYIKEIERNFEEKHEQSLNETKKKTMSFYRRKPRIGSKVKNSSCPRSQVVNHLVICDCLKNNKQKILTKNNAMKHPAEEKCVEKAAKRQCIDKNKQLGCCSKSVAIDRSIIDFYLS